MSIPQDHRVGRSCGAPAAIALHSKEYSMITTAIGLLLGLAIGAGCRWFDIPAPSPPKIVGALLVLFMTLGYLATDYLMPKAKPPAPVTMSAPISSTGVAHD